MPLITCIIDDTDGKNAAAGLPSHDVDELWLIDVWHGFEQSGINVRKYETLSIWALVGCIAQLAERRSLAGELTLFYARPVADG